MGVETAAIAGPLMGAGMGASAFGAYSSSKAAKSAFEAQAQINRNNAMVAGWQADDAITRGGQTASRLRMRSNQLKGTQRAQLAANGVDLGEGSALNILTDTEYMKEVDASTAVDNAAREAWALRNQAQGYTNEASLMKSRADAESPLFAAGTSLLGSAGRVAATWYAGGASKPPVDRPYG